MLLERLWLMFRHEMSRITKTLPKPDGTFRSERLEAALGGEPGWDAWLLSSGEHPIGFALVRASDQPVRVLTSFFVVAAVRRTGVGTSFARRILAHYPGRWDIAYQDANEDAVRFWPRVAAGFDPAWRHEYRDVPGKEWLPPDSWVSFTVGDAAAVEELRRPLSVR